MADASLKAHTAVWPIFKSKPSDRQTKIQRQSSVSLLGSLPRWAHPGKVFGNAFFPKANRAVQLIQAFGVFAMGHPIPLGHQRPGVSLASGKWRGPLFDHLLVPTDGSVMSEMAVERAIVFAKSSGAEITFFHAQESFYGRTDAVTFRKGVTPWLPFRRPASTVASVPDRDHQVAD